MFNKIFGIGLSKTGTTTLTKVLNDAGFKIIHYPKESELFAKNNDGATDISVIPEYKNLDKTFNCKFVYTVRDKEEWLNSMSKFLDRRSRFRWPENHPFLETRKKVYGAKQFDRETYSNAFSKHREDIMTYFKDRENDLLILDIIGGDSPEKLAKFLNMSPTKFPKKFPVFYNYEYSR